jgi:hypothetical protein
MDMDMAEDKRTRIDQLSLKREAWDLVVARELILKINKLRLSITLTIIKSGLPK